MSMTLDQIDVMKEVINIGVGRAAGELNALLRTHISFQIPSVALLSPSELPKEIQNLSRERLTTVRLKFTGSFDGNAALVFPYESASKLVAALTHKKPGTPELGAVRADTLSKVGNLVINGVIDSISNMLKQRLDPASYACVENTVENLFTLSDPLSTSEVLLTQAYFMVTSLQIEGSILLLFPLHAG
jgi:chemotaxis protein CheC